MKLRFVLGWLVAGAGAGAAVGCLGAAFNEGAGGGAAGASSSAGSAGTAGGATASSSHAASSTSAASSSGTLVCDGTKTGCSGKCFDLQIDPNHCGACDVACSATKVCSAGACACRPGFSPCGPAGPAQICVDWQHDPDHCGSCTIGCKPGEVCVPANGSSPPTCTPGACPGGTTDCDGGCYTSLDNAQLDCGGCGNACLNTEACANGSCELAYVVPSCVDCTATAMKCCTTSGLNFCYPLTGSCPGN